MIRSEMKVIKHLRGNKGSGTAFKRAQMHANQKCIFKETSHVL